MKNWKKIVTVTLAAALAMAMTASSVFAGKLVTDTVYETDFATLEEVNAAAAELSNQIADEGVVLLKNNGVLPLNGNEWVTLYSNSDSMIVDGMENVGFTVYYGGVNVSNFSDKDKNAYKTYGDAVIITISGGNGGEGKTDGYLTSEIEDNMDADGNVYTYADGTPFVHAAEAFDGTNYYKHPLEIKQTAEDLISFVTSRYDKVIVLLTGSSPIEAGILRDNDKIDAILWTGTLGDNGFAGGSYSGWGEVGRLLSGEVNPSGRTVDTWAYDFTANPTWANDGNSGKSFTSAAEEEAYGYENVSTTKAWRDETGEYRTRSGHTNNDVVDQYYTVEYEEDMYVGYRYYETMAADYDDYVYENAVAFPFGFGLSYTDFDWEVVSVDDGDWGKAQADWANGGKITLEVKVTNTGAASGKDVVEIYGHSPYLDGGIEKPEVTLVGFEKTSLLRPGQSEVVTLEVNIQDLASFDYTDANGNGSKTYELDATDGYELRVSKNSHDVVEAVKLAALDADVILGQDDYSGNDAEVLFSNADIYNLLGYDPETGMNLVEEGKMTLMSRDSSKGGLKGTFPTINTGADMVRSDKYFQMVDAFADMEADANYGEGSYYNLSTGKTAASEAETDLPWVKTEADIPADWDQEESAEAQAADKEALGDNWINFRDMKGVPLEDPKWTSFMNELTYEEMATLVSNGGYQTIALEAVEKLAGRYMDNASTVDMEMSEDAFNWGDCPHTAATWNKDLMYRRGVLSGNIGLFSQTTSMMSVGKGLTGWYAPAVDLHRSPFGGRTAEYFSEDGYLTGHIAGNIIAGMASYGILCTLKHVALNENETQRQALFTYVSEQAAREIYFRAYQIALQEYDCGAIMTAYNNVGEVHSDSNYAFMQKLMREEWGWEGFQTTDAVSPMSNFFSMDTMLRAGGNLLLGSVSEASGAMLNTDGNCAVSGTYDKANRQVVLADGSASPTQWYWLRTAAQTILYTEANSKQSQNGLDLTSYADEGGTLPAATQGSMYECSIDAEIPGVTLDYKVVAGEIPDGMEITSAGSYTDITESSDSSGGSGGGESAGESAEGESGAEEPAAEETAAPEGESAEGESAEGDSAAEEAAAPEGDSAEGDSGEGDSAAEEAAAPEGESAEGESGDGDSAAEEAAAPEGDSAEGDSAEGESGEDAAAEEPAEEEGDSAGDSAGGSDGGQAPAGISNAVLAGIPTTPGHYVFTIQAVADGWITGEAEFEIDVESGMILTDPIDNLKVGEEYIGAIDFERVGSYNEGVVFAVADGYSMPQGLTLSDDGIIEGTPMIQGVYTVPISITGTTSTENMMHQFSYDSETFTTEFVFTITE